jgi:predicted DNA-binding protein YlxM (UPF0122 family)
VEQMVRTGLLYDFYGGLLTAKQRQAMELYYLENWSLAEIAATSGVSKQAVHDLLHRSERIIEELEAKLGLLQRFIDQQEVLSQVSRKLQQVIASLPDGSRNHKMLTEINQQILGLAEAEME